MATTNKWGKSAATGAGIVGAVIVACTACCLPLVAPVVTSLLASAGVYSIGNVINPWLIGGAAALVFVVAFMGILRWQKSNTTGTGTCGCQNSCKT